MIDLLWLFVPFFALVLMGWAAARGRLLPLEGIGAMNTFVLFFGLPAMVFRLSAGGALQQSGLLGLLLAYGAAGAVIVSLALVWGVRAGLVRRDSGLLALVTVFPNTGFLGLPLLTGLLGPQAAGPVAATLLVDVLVLSSLCLAWAHSQGMSQGASSGAVSAQERGASEALQAALTSLRGALRNPLLWSMAAGLLASWWGLVLPQPVDETLRLLSLSATPAALFTLGAMLARAQMLGPTDRRDSAAVWGPTLLKLVLHPGLVWLAGMGLRSTGLAVPDAGLITLTLAAALPSASNVSMLAEREGADTALVARVILWTTAAALLTVACWAHGLGVRPP
ncbi:MAG TPA: AEC family transporter [Aquabacterium sp.]|uniref:AEC family transporter n=1 Tax=Aquabacterium sp. TaxID=1872578 RepID=UPI002E34AEC6|nr:AEC family transporter [Aquabacterium sp.]HEX5372450.1 AEC family transporter [Aquabacterium sp.]